MNETNDGIRVVEGNELGEDAMQSEEYEQYEESEDHDQPMERPRRSNALTAMDRLEMSFDGKSYVHGQNCQLLMMK